MLPPIPNLVSSHRGHDDLYGSLDVRRATPNGRQFAFSTLFLVTAAGFPVAGGTLQRSVSSPTRNMALLGSGNSELLQIMRQTTG